MVVALLLAAAAALVVSFTPIPTHEVLYVVIAVPYLMLGAPVAVALGVWARRRLLVVVGALLSRLGPDLPERRSAALAEGRWSA